MTKELVARRADQTPHATSARDLSRTAIDTSMIVINASGLVPVAQRADILPFGVPPERLSKRLVLFWGKIILLCYVREPTGQ